MMDQIFSWGTLNGVLLVVLGWSIYAFVSSWLAERKSRNLIFQPIGKIESLEETDKGIKVNFKFDNTQFNEAAAKAKEALSKGIMQPLSIFGDRAIHIPVKTLGEDEKLVPEVYRRTILESPIVDILVKPAGAYFPEAVVYFLTD